MSNEQCAMNNVQSPESPATVVDGSRGLGGDAIQPRAAGFAFDKGGGLWHKPTEPMMLSRPAVTRLRATGE